MMLKRSIAFATIVLCLSLLVVVSQTFLTLSLLGLLTVTSIVLGVLFVVWVHILLSLSHKSGTGVERIQKDIELFHNKLMNNDDVSPRGNQDHLPVVLGRTIDHVLQQLIDHFIRDFIEFYFNQYAFKPSNLIDNIKEDIWGAVQNLHDRMSRVDHVSLLSCDMINKITTHFERIRESQTLCLETQQKPLFKISPFIIDQETELNYLRQLSEMLIMFLLPRSYSLPPAKYFLREVLARKVFYTAIDTFTDPDFFNQHVIMYIEAQKVANLMHRRTFEYANSFEDFLKVIEKTDDVETLKRFRYDIVTKIMQAMTLQNMKRAKGGGGGSANPEEKPANKSDANEARKLKRYIDQLQAAKKECENKLITMGWEGGVQSFQVLPLQAILEDVWGRKYLTQFLETMASQGLVGYWTMVEELKIAQRKNWHQIGTEIFYTYIRNPSGEIKVDKSTRKRMEAFLLGDKGPEVFYEVQKQVVKLLEDKYYQPFVNGDFYAEMINAISSYEGLTEPDDGKNSSSVMLMEERQNSNDSNGSTESNGIMVGEHSNYSRKKLNQLQEKLNNKTQALRALQSSLKPESRLLKLLQQEVEWLQGERRQLEAHLTRTEIWGENLGKWRAVVQNAELPDEKEPPVFVIVVHMVSEEADEEETTRGWVVSRTLTQFQELHRKLRPMCSEVKSLELPSQTFKFPFAKSEKNNLEKAKVLIQKYLEFVLEDDRLNQSEPIYTFLSPSSDHLKETQKLPKITKFSFSTLFKSNDSSTKSYSLSQKESEDEDVSQYLDAPGSVDLLLDGKSQNGHSKQSESDTKDTVAEPIYALMLEIFNLSGVFKYLRKTMITFVQITYGRSINRQIYDIINWYFSEKMLHYYITEVTKSFWPQGVLAEKTPKRTEWEKRIVADEARKMFIVNVPEILTTLVGCNSARIGAKRVFDTLQNKTMNKQLLYELLEVFVVKAFPEVNVDK